MIVQLKRWLGRERPQDRHCRDCGAVVPRIVALCPRCRGMDFDDGRRNAHDEGTAERVHELGRLNTR